MGNTHEKEKEKERETTDLCFVFETDFVSIYKRFFVA